ncbi:MAG: NAD-dependent epimerase/dehydratase family protein [Candidatus Omnitrophica bacterium]|nr:NAD-dependent epimerase/dehydratase family protein [Candidatus Omnitrophota bacterium]
MMWPRKMLSCLLIMTCLSLGVCPGRAFAQVPAMRTDMLSFRGMKIYPADPFRFDFILEQPSSEGGHVVPSAASSGKVEVNRLIKYFLAAVTIPEKDIWVNLSPYEGDRVMARGFGQTQMGKDVLSEDYLLKQVTASLMHPDNGVGKKFWAEVYKQAQEKFGTTDIAVDTFNKVWIMPESASVYEKDDAVYVIDSRLKVMLDSDHVAAAQEGLRSDPAQDLARDIIRQIIIPVLAKEVNEGKDFASLRQIYRSLILAQWFKEKIRSSLLSQAYRDKNKVEGITADDPVFKEKIYQQYVDAFKKGAHALIREEYDPIANAVVPRKYFSGGIVLGNVPWTNAVAIPNAAQRTDIVEVRIMPLKEKSVPQGKADQAMLKIPSLPDELKHVLADIRPFDHITGSPDTKEGELSGPFFDKPDGLDLMYRKLLKDIPGISVDERTQLKGMEVLAVHINARRFGMPAFILREILRDLNVFVQDEFYEFDYLQRLDPKQYLQVLDSDLLFLPLQYLNAPEVNRVIYFIQWAQRNSKKALEGCALKWHYAGFRTFEEGATAVDLKKAFKFYFMAMRTFYWLGNDFEKDFERTKRIAIAFADAYAKLSDQLENAPVFVSSRPFLRDDPVLIIGGSGYIGGNLVKLLRSSGYMNIVDLDRRFLPGRSAYDHYYFDMRSPVNIAQIMRNYKGSTVINLSPFSDASYFDTHIQDGIEASIGAGLQAVLTMARRNGNTLIQAGTSLVYASKSELIDEGSTIEPLKGIYTEVMRIKELLSERYFKVNTITLRFSNVYGPGDQDDKVMNKFIKSMEAGESITIYPDAKDFIYIADVVKAIKLTLEKKIPPGVYNISTGVSTTISYLATALMLLLGKQVPTKDPGAHSPQRHVLSYMKFFFATLDDATGQGWSPTAFLDGVKLKLGNKWRRASREADNAQLPKDGGVDLRDIQVERHGAGASTVNDDQQSLHAVLGSGLGGFKPVVIGFRSVESLGYFLGISP